MTDNPEQLSLLNEQPEADNTSVVCLGMTFENEEARRRYFREELRKKLPELKQIEGFPSGEDEDIIALSDPPYYTVCPNPWLEEVVLKEMKVDKNYPYEKLPYIGDVAEGKNDAVYNAHSYHTKVPYKAIMRYILHYTEPGDLIFDGFSGTGMTGVASKRCGNQKEIEKLGYDIVNGDIINNNEVISKLGERNIILSDLSPAASLISQNYNRGFNLIKFEQEANRILDEVEKECAWLYKLSGDSESLGNVNYTVWSDVFICPSCANEIIYWDVAVNTELKKMYDKFQCKHCSVQLQKKSLERKWHYVYDEYLKENISMAKQVPVNVNYSIGTKRYDQDADEAQLNLLKKIDNYKLDHWVPLYRMPEGDESRRNDRIGITHVHQYFTKRNLIALSNFYKHAIDSKYINQLLFFFQASITRATKTNRFRFGGTGGLSGTLYIPSLTFERNVVLLLRNKLRDFLKMIKEVEDEANNKSIITTQSTTAVKSIPDNSIDYIFTDPPFGKNLMYSELNFLWEAWLKVLTNNKSEAIMNNTQKKTLFEYQKLMENSFAQYFRVLKPGRWITIEFSNSQASVWNSIQESLQKVGFVIADVSALDKKQGSFKAVTTTIAVKQDLVITAYKPSSDTILKMREKNNTTESAWIFVNQHLEKLPKFLGSKGEASVIAERTPRILFDRMVAYHVQNGLPVPISSADFQEGVTQRFPMRDGMAFIDAQVAEYDKKRTLVKDFSQMSLFVSDENSAIEWIRQQLMKKPQTRQDLHPQFMKEIQHIAKHEDLPELDNLLLQNFLRFEGDESAPDQIGSYLRRNYHEFRGLENTDDKLKEKAINRWYVPNPNKQADLEKLREKTLLREFESYVEELSTHKKKLRQFRTEAVRAGFKKAWSEKDYEKIVTVGDRLPETVIQEDDKLLMYYDNAQVRLGM
ncbi:DNA methyltransferase [Sporosarcina beigongshangi]|uniref:DNA methyltransferase n=1 Tax=Sporosarcina beigongshangi TaxID=2782538 RepID=UPI00193A160A|nr:DNA methyltransferase [Sporosarcina beigongshangi]